MVEILSDRSIIELKGEASLGFLQNLITNDIVKNKYCYAYMLSNLGRYLFDFFVYKLSNEHIFIDINLGSAEALTKKLNFYKLRAQIEIGINDKYQVLYSHKPIADGAIYSLKDPRFSSLGYRSLVQKGADLVGDNDDLYINDKYNYAIPDGYIDLKYDKSIPVEYGAEELHSIDYHKGCYVGQEIISRTKYQGVIRKKIFKVIASDALDSISSQMEIKSGDTVLGICCSYHKNVGIALIREEKLDMIENESITIDNIPVELVIPEWRRI